MPPSVDGDTNPSSLADGVEHLIQRIADAYQGEPGPKLRLLPEECIGAQLFSHEEAQGGIQDLVRYFQGRIPGKDVTPEQLRACSWWTGGASRASFDPILQRLDDIGTTGILLSGSPEEGQLIGKVKAAPAPPGRAQIVSRDHGVVAAQLAFMPSKFEE